MTSLSSVGGFSFFGAASGTPDGIGGSGGPCIAGTSTQGTGGGGGNRSSGAFDPLHFGPDPPTGGFGGGGAGGGASGGNGGPGPTRPITPASWPQGPPGPGAGPGGGGGGPSGLGRGPGGGGPPGPGYGPGGGGCGFPGPGGPPGGPPGGGYPGAARGSPRPTVREAEKIVLPAWPTTATYPHWLRTAFALICAASGRPNACARWLQPAMNQTRSPDDLIREDEDWESLGAKLEAAFLQSARGEMARKLGLLVDRWRKQGVVCSGRYLLRFVLYQFSKDAERSLRVTLQRR